MSEEKHVCGTCGKKLEANLDGDRRCDDCNPEPEGIVSNIIVLEDE